MTEDLKRIETILDEKVRPALRAAPEETEKKVSGRKSVNFSALSAAVLPAWSF